MLLGPMLRATAQRAPGKLALWFGDRSWTYSQFDDATDRLAANLAAAGVQSGDRVALFGQAVTVLRGELTGAATG